MARIHIWGGGPYHPYREQGGWLIQQLSPWGNEVVYSEERSVFDWETLSRADLLIIMGLEWSGMMELDASLWEDSSRKPERYEPFSDEHMTAVQRFLSEGRALLCLHAGLASFDDRPEFEEIFDGRFVWGQSTHPPYAEFEVQVVHPEHPILAGVGNFVTPDELYYNLREPRRSAVLLEAEYDGRRWPLAWAGSYGEARTAYIALGHDMRSFATPSFQSVVHNAISWLLDQENS
ncbi:conserved hypothetical protein [Thermobaculum terrenum ATCC BAA-798]|uniref:ThuA-like domain-containing protein n=1 Tax=Thermobaculum terrenum (strain ATCC BAA-798 / CCMEE 7001 / YNP1) TaxID=525904 RepID=D1CGE1_THET1|nr:ThuA domain-containing protein [Thermobaculum terrenum]ACZ42812.1 conserved hypothetical protein [Thermobaculum terrenum ATCC BAA-798]